MTLLFQVLLCQLHCFLNMTQVYSARGEALTLAEGISIIKNLCRPIVLHFIYSIHTPLATTVSLTPQSPTLAIS
jgi:hypothetical protein